ncbi:hypothetical protein [Bradyrhizobium sp. CB1015]|uniref:hypothetical protein n=1 Tax=Bradyrhizobium sp. CB1015 TaxID=2976822 RepID=UPI0021AAE28A|nr:hypothetical protein [Bradyrhizobium sp. CB1015]UWU91328.1 hypothetical protein N2604_33595 [Bradyrhizobium sp. CB1015]
MNQATAFGIAKMELMTPRSHVLPITILLSPYQKRTTSQLLPRFARFIDIQQRKRWRARAGVLRLKRSLVRQAQLLQRGGVQFFQCARSITSKP